MFELSEWDFLFSGEWGNEKITNSKSQILARIKQFVIEQNFGFKFTWRDDYNYIVANPKYLDQTPFKL